MPEEKRFERRTRVMFNLPLNSSGEEKALAQVVRHLKARRKSSVGVTGFTLSDYPLTSFTGLWWSEPTRSWIEDGIVLCILDLHAKTQDAIDSEIVRIRHQILAAYEQHGSSQEDVWIVAHPVVRFA